MTLPSPHDRYLCICADDFGLSEGVNAAILDLAERGRISATGCMVRRPAWETGRSRLRRIDRTRLDVGLHLDLTPPPPGDAREPGLAALIAKGWLGLLRPAEIRAEIADQLSRFEDGFGRAPAFVDGHRHVHQFAVVRDMLVAEIATRYGAAAPWIRNTAPPAPRWRAGAKANLVFALGGAGLLERAARHGILASRGLLGVYGFDGGAADYRRRLWQWIAACRSGDVLMCHPALADAPSDPIAAARRHEYAVLAATVFPMQTQGGAVFLAPLSRQPRAEGPRA
ncbi:hopanoid biosynthesis associated protein HpnK [Variovorax sp. SRS16]|uniref:ChbG/HpnK family deacetylase n=1 Tax=Variovorax sp. SRS16 TaxID=282217 RepID=UPI001318C651|nr:ChbG/HpnK family deacetylase [Variovorax sp. SRS16]VTU26443.1 hopanoid biosynthesis associated protein HpnK [Variovorax sp. SRS16]